jgi:hypothetical protein
VSALGLLVALVVSEHRCVRSPSLCEQNGLRFSYKSEGETESYKLGSAALRASNRAFRLSAVRFCLYGGASGPQRGVPEGPCRPRKSVFASINHELGARRGSRARVGSPGGPKIGSPATPGRVPGRPRKWGLLQKIGGAIFWPQKRAHVMCAE